jgi:hypothetical protein
MEFIRRVRDGGYYDVIVCGAGPAGIGASLSAAQMGLRVLLLESAGCLGGCWTSGLMSIALDIIDKGGIPRRIMDRLMSDSKAQWADSESYVYHAESMKHLLEQMVKDAGVDISLYTRVTDVTVESGRIGSILADGFGSSAYRAGWFVDATGHGTLSALAGCTYLSGYPGSSKKQPASLEALVSGVPDTWHSDIHNPQKKRELYELFQSVGIKCSYPSPLLFQNGPDARCWKLAINQQYGVDVRDPQTITNATIAARDEIYRAVEALRTLPGWESLTLVTTAEQIGLRDNKRIEGLYRITGEDCLAGRTFSDGVVPVRYFLDVHELSKEGHVKDGVSNKQTQPYQLPMRCLISREIRNLFMAGRCLSGDFYAHSSYRMTNTACATGEAVGLAIASLSGKDDNTLVDGTGIRSAMLGRGYVL